MDTTSYHTIYNAVQHIPPHRKSKCKHTNKCMAADIGRRQRAAGGRHNNALATCPRDRSRAALHRTSEPIVAAHSFAASRLRGHPFVPLPPTFIYAVGRSVGRSLCSLPLCHDNINKHPFVPFPPTFIYAVGRSVGRSLCSLPRQHKHINIHRFHHFHHFSTLLPCATAQHGQLNAAHTPQRCCRRMQMNSSTAVVPTARFVASLEIVLGLLYSILSFADFAALLDDERRRMLECSLRCGAAAVWTLGLCAASRRSFVALLRHFHFHFLFLFSTRL